MDRPKVKSVVDRHDGYGILVAIIAAIVFGMYPAASRAAYADGANAAFILIISTLFRTSLFVAFCRITKKPMFAAKEHTKAALTGGAWQGISTICIIASLAYIQGPVLLTILFSSTVMLLFFMAWRKEAVLDSITLVSTAMVFVGMTIALDLWNVQSSSNWVGYGLALLAALGATSRIYVYSHQMKTRNPAIVGAESFVVASVVILAAALWHFPVQPASVEGWYWTFLASLSLAIGSFLTFYGIALLGAFKWSLFLKIEPIFTSLFSVLFLGEFLKTTQYIGIALVVGSLVVYQILNQRKVSRLVIEQD